MNLFDKLSPPSPDPAAIAGTDPTTPPTAIGDPVPPTDQDTPETAPPADPAPTPAPDLKAGQLVSHTYFDPYIGAGGEEVEQVALVVAVKDGQALVAFLPVSGPLPVDELTPGSELV